ncbi:glycosyltransferase family 2 protein [bacterium]|nr:glycosyltransferase family 2 protein [bacterium]
MKENSFPDLSIVVPIYNEEENVDDLIAAITAAMQDYTDSYEVVLVDDGSTDRSFEILKRHTVTNPKIRVIRFGINYGQTAAISAGFHHARGRILVTMDADLQNDPTDIPRLIEKMQEDWDVVSGWRKDRFDKFLTRRLPSMMANHLISYITGLKLKDYGCTLKAYRSDVAKRIELYGEMHRFIPALARWGGASVSEIVVKHHARKKGTSKYGISRTLRVLLDLFVVKFLMTYSTQPIQIFGGLGLLIFFLSVILLGVVVVLRIFAGVDMSGNPLLYVSLTGIMLSVVFLFMGLQTEMQVRTYHESQRKPIYVVKEIIEYQTEPLIEMEPNGLPASRN